MNKFGYFPIYNDPNDHDKQRMEANYQAITIKNTTGEHFKFRLGHYYTMIPNGIPDPSNPPHIQEISLSAPNKDIFTTPPPHSIEPNATISYVFNPQFTNPNMLGFICTSTNNPHNAFDIVLSDQTGIFLPPLGVEVYEFDVASNYVRNHGTGTGTAIHCRNAFFTFGFETKRGGDSSPDSLSITIREHVWTSKLTFWTADENGHRTGGQFENVKILANGKIEMVIPNLEKFQTSSLSVRSTADTPVLWESLPNHYSCHSWGPETQFPNILTASNLLFHFEAYGDSGDGITLDYYFVTELA